MNAKARKRAQKNVLSKESARKIWMSLESSAGIVDKHAEFQRKQETIAKKQKAEKKAQFQQIHAAARASREAAERKAAEDAYAKPSKRHKAIRTQKVDIEKRQDEDLPEVQSPPPKNLFKFEKVKIERDIHADMQRSQLPVIRHEQEIMENVLQSSDKTCLVVSGDTGTGKTTQVPQFLWEYGFPAMIGITQPRRVAVYAMANRLRAELGVTTEVGYQVRHDKSVDPETTRMKFMTEGILLREIQQDFALRQYSALIIDEVHERSVDCDILLGLLSRIIPLRSSMGNPLAVILMSATMNTSVFTENPKLFPHPPPIVSVESRRFELTEHYALQSSSRLQYLDDAFAKCVQIHTRLPHGAILCFVPTQKDCETLSKRLQAYFQRTPTRAYKAKVPVEGRSAMSRKEKHDFMLEHAGAGEREVAFEEGEDPEQAILEKEEALFDLNAAELSTSSEEEHPSKLVLDTLVALPLYANLDEKSQRRVFDEVPSDRRLCVIATNVAETSLTIPDVRYVVDTGYVKERNYDTDANTYRSNIVRISMSSARQRAGRAGRTMPGHVYRLYTPACYGTFASDAKPEIERTPIERVVLLLSVFKVNPMRFPFPSAVAPGALSSAVDRLVFLGALEGGEARRGTITSLGSEIIHFPIVPRLAAVLVHAKALSSVVQHTLIDAVAAASSTTHFFQRFEKEDSSDKHPFVTPGSDFASYAKFLDAFRRSNRRGKLCRATGVSYRVAAEACKLSGQIHRLLSVDSSESSVLRGADEVLFRKALCKGFLDCIAKRKRSADTPGAKAVYSHDGEEYRLHPSSHCAKVRPAPEFVLFSTIESTAKGKKRLCGLTIVTVEWLVSLGYAGDIV